MQSASVIQRAIWGAFLLFTLTVSGCGGGSSGSGSAGDATVPVMRLLGANPLILPVGDVYTDPGTTASDNVDGDITGNIVVAGTVNTAIAGSYVVTYDVNDAAGNLAIQLTRTVIVDGAAPVIALLGANPLNFQVGDRYIDPGATASDNVDGDITGNIVVTGRVNTTVEGAYTVTYDVSDEVGNAAAQVTRTVNVDGTSPVITLLGANPLVLLVGDTYTDPGVTALDNVDGDLTGNIVVAGTVNTATGGAYAVTYDVSDAAGNPAAQLTRTIIVDGTAPVITLLGANLLNLQPGDTYTDFGATASDNIGGDLTGDIVVAGTVNTAIEGTYVVTYNVSDVAGNTATQVIRTVNVDGAPPVITLLGANPLNFQVGDVHTDPGATASDNLDGDITGNIVVAGDAVNTAVAGAYVVTYNVSDAAGNAAIQLTRTVNVDGTAPVITLLGANPLDLQVSDTYTDPGATAADNLDDDITGNIVVAGDTVDTAVAGAYTVTYDVSDAAGNAAAQVTRTVNVVNTPPVITSFSMGPDPVFSDSAASFSWNVSDTNGDTLTCKLDIENDGTDDFTINDCANNTSQLHTYTVAGDYVAKLTVDDGVASPVVATTGFIVIAPLSTDVSVNAPAVVAERMLYTITVGNVSPEPIDNVTVSLLVPAELSFDDINDAEPDEGSGCGSFCDPTEEANWSLGTLAAGESRTISVNALVDVATFNGTSITLPVTFSATNVSNTQIDKTVEVFSAPSADLALGASTDPVVANETFSYLLDFGNTSAGPLSTVELRAFLPPGVTVNSISDGGTEVSTGVVVWNEASIGVGASLHREIMVTADDGLTAGQILKTTARLTYDNGQAVDNTAEHVLTVAPGVLPLEVDISTSANPVVANERVLYTLTVSNSSLFPVNDVLLKLRVPAELTFDDNNDAEPDEGSGCGTLCAATEEANWSLGTLAAGESRTITINALVANVPSGNLITTPVRVTATNLGDTIDLLNTVAVFSSPSADLALSASTDSVVANETFSYQLDFGNTSAGSLSTVELRAFLPPGVTVSSISDGGTEVSTGVVVWNEASPGVGASLRREIMVIASAVSAGQILPASAQLTHDGGQVVDNTVEHAMTVVSTAVPLQVNISTSANPVVANERVLYTLTVSNSSLLPVNDVLLKLRVPAELSFDDNNDAEPDEGTGCGTFCDPTDEANWSLGTLAAGESRTVTINALVASVLSGNLITTPVRVTATNLGDTIDLLNTVAVFSAPSADLALSASTDPVVANETFSYQLDFGNISAGALSTVELRAFLPPGVTVNSISDGGTEVSTGVVVWNEASLEVGASLHREVTVTASAVSAGQILPASAQLSHDGGQAVDNTAEYVLTVAPAVLPLEVDISTSANPVVANKRVLYTLTISNSSLLPVYDVMVELRVPAELSFDDINDAEPDEGTGCGSFCDPTDDASWSLGTLEAGESRTITINALVDSVLSGNLITTPVRVTAANLGDTIDLLNTVAVFSAPSADLALSASTDPVVANETFSYQLDFGNTSAGLLTTVELRAFLPPGVAVSSISDGGLDAGAGAGEIVWSVASMISGAFLHREVAVTADGFSAGHILALHAELSFDGGLEIDNQSEFAVSVAKTAGIASLLSVNIVATPDPVASTGVLAYTLTVSNDYALPVDNVVVKFRVPAELSFDDINDAEPDEGTGCGAFCNPAEEATWNLGTLAAGVSQVITINATVAEGLVDGTMISVPVSVTATGMEDTINLQHTTVIEN